MGEEKLRSKTRLFFPKIPSSDIPNAPNMHIHPGQASSSNVLAFDKICVVFLFAHLLKSRTEEAHRIHTQQLQQQKLTVLRELLSIYILHVLYSSLLLHIPTYLPYYFQLCQAARLYDCLQRSRVIVVVQQVHPYVLVSTLLQLQVQKDRQIDVGIGQSSYNVMSRI